MQPLGGVQRDLCVLVCLYSYELSLCHRLVCSHMVGSKEISMSKFDCILMYCLCVIGWFAATRWGTKRSLCRKFACILMYSPCVIGWFEVTRWVKRSLCRKFVCILMYCLCVIGWFEVTRWGQEISMS